MSFRLWLKTDARVGAGVSLTLIDYLKERRADRVAVILDSGPSKNPHVQILLERLADVVTDLQVVETSEVEPTYDYLDEFRREFSTGLDLVIGIGGGSTLDLTKAVSVLVTNPRPAIEYRGFDLIEEPGIPVVALPTTAGTGSEVTPNAVFTDSREGRKFGINTEMYVPVLALLDPNLVASCPRSVAVSAGVDALVHAVESFVANGATPASRLFSREGFRLVTRNLLEVLEHPDDLDAWSSLQFGALLAATGLMNGGGGLTGALSYPLGAQFKVPHGLAGGVFLSRVSRHNVDRGAEAYAGLADLLPDCDLSSDAASRAVAVCDELDRLSDALDLPRLSSLGIADGDLDGLAVQTFMLSGAIEQNPVPLSESDVRHILEAAL